MSAPIVNYATLIDCYLETLEQIYQASPSFKAHISKEIAAMNFDNSAATRQGVFRLDLNNYILGNFIAETDFSQPALQRFYQASTPQMANYDVKAISDNIRSQIDRIIWDNRVAESADLSDQISPLFEEALSLSDCHTSLTERFGYLQQTLLLQLRDDLSLEKSAQKAQKIIDGRLKSIKIRTSQTGQSGLDAMAAYKEITSYIMSRPRPPVPGSYQTSLITPTTEPANQPMRPSPREEKNYAHSGPNADLTTADELDQPITPRLEELLNEMDQMTGLTEVKKMVHELVDTLIIQNERKKRGKKTTPMSLHMAFSGNPGTGKTTLARFVAEILKELNVLSKGHFIEARRSDLTGSHIGESEKKTREILNKAEGGVLFIDEIQSLIPAGEKDFSREVNTEIVAAMENNRDDLVVIIAGYPEKVDKYIACDDGFNDRFAIRIQFPDYETGELKEIFKSMLAAEDFSASEKSLEKLDALIDWEKSRTNQGFGNARFMRSLRDFSMRAQHTRLRHGKKDVQDLTDRDLDTITAKDLEKGADTLRQQRDKAPTSETTNKQGFIGFVDPNETTPPQTGKKKKCRPMRRRQMQLRP